MSKPTNRRHWLRFSLGSLLVVTTVLCIALAVVFNRVRRQREAVAAFEAVEGKISYRQLHTTSRLASDPPPGPPWLLAIVGDDFFRRPNSVSLHGQQITDELLLEHLAGVRTTGYLNLSSPFVTDACMDEVAALHELQRLNLRCPQLTDAGLRKLKRLEKLTALSITSPRMTDKALSDLAALKKVDALYLQCPLLTPAGVRKLKGMGNVTSVSSLRDLLNDSLAQRLEQKCLNEFIEVPTSDALGVISDQHYLKIDASAIPEARLDLPFNWEHPGRTLSQLLDELLAPIEADYFLEKGTIKIVAKKNGQPYRAGYRAFKETFPNCKRIMVDW